MMINRKSIDIVTKKLELFPTVGLLGPRQVGKTTLAHLLLNTRPALYLDLENYQDLAKLADPLAYFSLHTDKLIILDEIQRQPNLFMSLRSVIDERRRAGQKYGQFLVLGSASLDLLRQDSESLAGRISYIELNPINIAEIASTKIPLQQLWLRGGFPESLLARSDNASIEWRQAFLKTYLERDIPQFSPRLPSETLRRLWIMLAHLQGTLLNSARLASSLGISGQTITRYIDLLIDLFLIRRLSPWHNNGNRRLVRSPKIYVRDSGILHALLGIHTMDYLISHPIIGQSWKGFVIDNILSFLPLGAEPYFYRTSSGAEIDLVIKYPNNIIIAIEIKNSTTPKLEKGFYEACKEIEPTYRYIVYRGNDKFPIKNDVYAISLPLIMQELEELIKIG